MTLLLLSAAQVEEGIPLHTSVNCGDETSGAEHTLAAFETL